jgi:hypothetical protein
MVYSGTTSCRTSPTLVNADAAHVFLGKLVITLWWCTQAQVSDVNER